MPAFPASDIPHRLSDLTQGEHMLVWTFRAAAAGAGRCVLVRRTFEDACGPMGSETLNALLVFVRELAIRGRRQVSLAVPGTLILTRDEQLILAVFAAAQAEDYGRMEAHLAYLTGADPAPAFAAVACLVGDAFTMNGLVLRTATLAAPPPPVAAEPTPLRLAAG